jgi:hypothetical protein
MTRLSLCLTLAMTAPLFACGGSPASPSGTLTVHGTLPPTTKPLDNARAVAMGADGHTFGAYLTRTGQFTLNLPVGHAYMIVFANSRLGGSESVIGHLVIHTSNGVRSFLGARAAGQIDLGTISLAQGGSVVPQGAGSLKIACNCTGGGDGGDEGAGNPDGGGGGGDYGCHEDDGECDSVCDGGGDDEMGCENDPGDDCESDDLDDEGGKSTCQQHVQQPCGGGGYSSSSSGSSSSSSSSGSSGSSGGEGSSSGSGSSSGGGYSSSGGGYSSSSSGGSTPPNGNCQVNSQCGSGVCCGGVCHSGGDD